MKNATQNLIILILLLISSKSFSQLNDPRQKTRAILLHDTLTITEPTSIKVIKIGSKCYSISKHPTTIEEAKPQIILGDTWTPGNWGIGGSGSGTDSAVKSDTGTNKGYKPYIIKLNTSSTVPL